MPAPCAVCGATSTQRCGQCRQTWYCSVEHQREHWTTGGHRVACGLATVDEIRENMVLSYYDGCYEALRIVATLRLNDCAAAETAVEALIHRVVETVGRNRDVATQRVGAQTLSVEALAQNRRAAVEALLHEEQQSPPSSNDVQSLVERIREDIGIDKPVGYYCGLLDVTNVVMRRLMRADLGAHLANVTLESTSALAVLGAVSVAGRELLAIAQRATDERVEKYAQECKQQE